MSIRSRVLNKLFGLLYGPLILLHEPAGKLLFGGSWEGRRASLVPWVPRKGVVLDIGCGSGALLLRVPNHERQAVGIDPSRAMLRRAHSSGSLVVQASAGSIPIADGTIDAVVCTYPGAWILRSDVWSEIARVTMPGAPVILLLGGTVTRGRFSRVRSLIIRLLYGSNTVDAPEGVSGALGHDLVSGQLQQVDDEWGTALIWEGNRGANS